MPKKNTTAEIVALHWTFHADNQFTYEQIATAAALEQVKETRALNFTMKQILGRLDSLGSDGLHRIIRAQAQVVDRTTRRMLARSRAKRKAAKLAKLRAAA